METCLFEGKKWAARKKIADCVNNVDIAHVVWMQFEQNAVISSERNKHNILKLY